MNLYKIWLIYWLEAIIMIKFEPKNFGNSSVWLLQATLRIVSSVMRKKNKSLKNISIFINKELQGKEIHQLLKNVPLDLKYLILPVN